MYSYCCYKPVVISVDLPIKDRHVPEDWYYCSHCFRPCDRINFQKPRNGDMDERF
jgi:hypothetical protein